MGFLLTSVVTFATMMSKLIGEKHTPSQWRNGQFEVSVMMLVMLTVGGVLSLLSFFVLIVEQYY